MATTVTFNKTQPILDTTKSTQLVRGSVALSGSYPAGGDPLNLSGFPVQSAGAPVNVWFTEAPSASVPPSGYGLYYQPGTNPSNGLLRITSTGGTEITPGAYSGISHLATANIIFEAVFTLGS